MRLNVFSETKTLIKTSGKCDKITMYNKHVLSSTRFRDGAIINEHYTYIYEIAIRMIKEGYVIFFIYLNIGHFELEGLMYYKYSVKCLR